MVKIIWHLDNNNTICLENWTTDVAILTLFYAGGGGIYAPPTTFRQFSSDVLIQGGSDYTLNSSFVIAEHMKLVPGQKNFPTARESPPKSAG